MRVFTKTMYFSILNAKKNIVTVCPLRGIKPQTTASSNHDENAHGSHSAAERSNFF